MKGIPGVQNFGGDWTEQKLSILSRYMRAYTTIMRAQVFRNGEGFIFSYIDAFAGTGYRQTKRVDDHSEGWLFPEYEVEAQEYMKGSAAIALDCEPAFHDYVFVEKDPQRAAELQKVVNGHPRREYARVLQRDANEYLEELGGKRWQWNERALVFVDPFAMQVRWSAIEALGNTNKVDLWLLVPLAAVNRCLQSEGKISEGLCHRLDIFFGTSDWMEALYRPCPPRDHPDQGTLFEDVPLAKDAVKKVPWQDVGAYIRCRLQTCFAFVPPAGILKCSNSPLFLLCFASANKTGAKIAKDLLRRLEQTG